MQQAGVAVTFAMKLGSRFIEQCAMDLARVLGEVLESWRCACGMISLCQCIHSRTYCSIEMF